MANYDNKKAPENKPVPLWDAEGKMRLYHSIDAKEILEMPDCQYSDTPPAPKQVLEVGVVNLKAEALPVEEVELKPRKNKDAK